MQDLLAGLRVVEASAFVAAPMCGMTLAQLGADVIRFDPIGGGIDYRRWPQAPSGASIYWAELNKGKRSLAVDFRSPEGQALITRLIASGDEDGGVFVTNLPARGWLSYDNLKREREDLIHVVISGDRHGGTAVDYTVNAKVGFPLVTGPSDDERPVNHVLPAWDCLCANQAAISVLAAERHRRRTGEGQHVDLALADTALTTLAHLGYIGDVMVNGTSRPRYGNYLYGAFGRDFVTRDDVRVMIIAISGRQWAGLLEATGLADAFAKLQRDRGFKLDDEGACFEQREAIAAVLEDWVKGIDCAELAARFDAQRVCWGRYQTIRQLVETDRDVSTDNPAFQMVDQPDIGRYLVADQPMQFSAVARQAVRPAPRLGEHTDEILADVLGLPAGEIGRLHDAGIVAGPPAT